jgi:3-oxoacyl-[acyl-carrier protein] reductase
MESLKNAPMIITAVMENDTMLKILPLMADIENAAVFLASNVAELLTGVSKSITSGTH